MDLANNRNRQAASHEQLQRFGARLDVDRDDLGRLIFEAHVTLASRLGIVSDRTRVMVSHVAGDTGEIVVFKSAALDISLYHLDFTAAFQTFTCLEDGVLRIEGNGPSAGEYVCEIRPIPPHRASAAGG